MKLQSKINFRFLAFSLVLFVVGSGIIYILLKKTLSNEVDESLQNQKKSIINYLSKHNFRDTLPDWPDNTVHIKIAGKHEPTERLADTLIRDELENELVPARMLMFSAPSSGKLYDITITQSLIESDDLALVIFGFMIFLFLTILGMLFLINRWISASVWKPFYK